MAHPDYEEFVAALNAHGVRYLIGGAHAVAFHARPRASKDIDIFIDPSLANARRALAALADFFGGAAPRYVTVETLRDPDTTVQLGVAPVRIDLLSSLAGERAFRTAWKRRVDARFGSVPAHYLRSKTSSPRRSTGSVPRTARTWSCFARPWRGAARAERFGPAWAGTPVIPQRVRPRHPGQPVGAAWALRVRGGQSSFGRP